jgi:DNA-directed RNA polymerase specialized sigma24 family protein
MDRRVEAGAMRSMDRDLIRATRLLEVPLDDYADELGISYEAAKKRRQRAEKALHKEFQSKL